MAKLVMSRSARNATLTASTYRATLSEFDAAREVVWTNVRRELAEALSDENREFQERLLDVLADVKTAALVASVRHDPSIADAALPTPDAASVLSALRLGAGNLSSRPSLGPGLVGRGWHQPEPSGPDCYARWSGPGSLSSIFMPRLERGSYWIEGRVRFFITEAVNGFRVRLGSEFVAPEMTAFDEDSWRFRVQLDLQQDSRSTFSRLEFFCPALGRPKDRGQTDDRTLGFFLSDVDLYRA